MNPIRSNFSSEQPFSLPRIQNSALKELFFKYVSAFQGSLSGNLGNRNIQVKAGIVLSLLLFGLIAYVIKSAKGASQKETTQPVTKREVPAKPESAAEPAIKTTTPKVEVNPQIEEKPYAPSIGGTFIVDGEYSQGRLKEFRAAIGKQNQDDDNLGSLACASICMQATLHFMHHGIPTNEKEMYTIMDEGVTFYKEQNFSGTVHFENILPHFPKLQSIIPDEKKDMGASRLTESTLLLLQWVHEITVPIVDDPSCV